MSTCNSLALVSLYLADAMRAFVLKSFTGLMIMQLLVSNLDLCCELQKLPSLLEHYQEHELSLGLSFPQFLDLHYGGETPAQMHHHDDEHDSQLPFSGQHHCHGPVTVATPIFRGLVLEVHWFGRPVAMSIYQFSVSSAFLDSPFQPPQV